MASVPIAPGVYTDDQCDIWILTTEGFWIDWEGNTRPVYNNWMLAEFDLQPLPRHYGIR